ncbi:recombinase family protein [Gemmata sp. JC717]|uniref:recombinase family protein n=1 Tax=Gemmata algarum TaxID=2975278 RepID=UPI0021BB7C7B|nr:recombinase family protein [Gemmata algarum]MDY3556297.1 recombinase family protein [Gemmata algarum]
MFRGDNAKALRNKVYPVKAYLYIRFSLKRQKDGKSIKRQTDWAADYCKRKGIALDETLTLVEEGRSGYHGHHLTESGKLGQFLATCKAGRIARGSVLIVEGFDRLSREHPFRAMELVRELVSVHGIVLVTIRPELEVTSGNIDLATHILMYIGMLTAHGESAKKSERSRYNWQERRRNIGTELLTKRVPGWLRVNDENKIEVVEEKAEVVRRVFDMAKRGHGNYTIARTLNDEKVPGVRGGIWRDGNVSKLLRNRAVLGEFQPHETVEGEIRPVGSVIPDYYPRVVSPELFSAVQTAISVRRLPNDHFTPDDTLPEEQRAERKAKRKATRAAGGGTGRGVANLFTGLAFIGEQSLQYQPHDPGGLLLTGDKSVGIRYDHFERIGLYWLREVKLHLSNGADLDSLQRREKNLTANIAKVKGLLDGGADMGEVLDSVAGWKRELVEVKKQIETAAVPLQLHFLHSQRLIEFLGSAPADEVQGLRREVRQVIRQIVQRIEVTVSGEKWRAKRIEVTVQFADGHSRGYWYETKDGRITAAGLLKVPGASLAKLAAETLDGIKSELEAEVRAGKRAAGVVDVRDVLGERLTFPVDPEPFAEVRAKCRELKAAGWRVPDIAVEVKLNKSTVYEYVRVDRV